MAPKKANELQIRSDKSQFAGWKFAGVISIFFAFIGLYVHQRLHHVPDLPEFDPDFWFGPGIKPKSVDESIRDFKIDISADILDDWKARLELPSRLRKPLEDVGFEYGFNTDYLSKVRKHWLENYSWGKEQEKLNKYPQFKTQINGMDIHFQRIKPSDFGRTVTNDKPVLPLLLLHGWPGSFVEFQKAIPLLMDTSDSPFDLELIIPSLPGYGFSDPASKPGLGDTEVAIVMNNLMTRLKFDKYYLQGGDWGAAITNIMSTLYPDRILGAHVNMAAVASGRNFLNWGLAAILPKSWFMDPEQVFMMFPMGEKLKTLMLEFGYMHLQSTKPDTVGLPPLESEVNYSLDDMLTNVMVYWVTNSITTSMRLYSESMNIRNLGYAIDEIPCHVPYGAAVFPHEIFMHPETFLADKFKNIVSYQVMPRGGHFAAFEEPELLSDHVKKFIGLVEESRVSAEKKNS
ncbi:unnamed protein product [Notodromas monacha]|uniref:Epoxide hydrolase n=1 Tax=Notodromas monacha TaxID=399045 RepID=A0A7R9GJC2_9CRUS|nr:unnamed protein product [Notodromas monacha]CAG0923499.1 unnamed protein product [Notodromas monacha]